MAKELAYVDRDKLVETADALRERLATTDTYGIEEFPAAIRDIQGGVTPETPTITVSNAGLITASANGLSATQQLTTQAAKTVTPTTSSQTAIAAGTYATGAVTVTAIPSGTLATPTITVSTSGLITATETQTTAGYIAANSTKSATQQLTTQAAATITPTESAQTAVVAGRYTTGAVTVAAIPSTYIGSGVTVNKYYTGSSNPASSLGNNGDLYLLVPSASSDPDGGEDSPIWEEEPIDEEENPFN